MTTLLPSLTGKSQAPLPDWRQAPKLVELRERRDRVEERSRVVSAGILRAKHELAEAREKDQRLAAERLLGRSTEAPTVAAGVESVLDRLLAEQREIERERAAFTAALGILEAEAMAAAAAELGKRYRAVLKRLDAALGEASRLAEEAEVVHALAAAQFDGSHGHPEAAGLPAARWPELATAGQFAKHGSPNPSALERFRTRLAEQGW